MAIGGRFLGEKKGIKGDTYRYKEVGVRRQGGRI